MIDPMFEYLLKNGGPKGVPETWAELADLYGIAQHNDDSREGRQRKAKAASERWNRFVGSGRAFELYSATVGKSGTTVKFKRKQTPDETPDTSGMPIEFITKTPQGGAYVRYKNKDGSISRKDFEEVLKETANLPIQKIKEYTPPKEAAQQIEIFTLGDIHIGMESEDNVFGLTWDDKKLFKRVDVLLSHVSQSTEKIYLVFGGDVADGLDAMTTRKRHKLPQNKNNKQQLRTSRDFVLKILDGISQRTDKMVEVVFLANSNHGGILDYAAGLIIDTCASQRYDGQIKFNLQEEFVKMYKVGGFDLFITHGYDEEYMKKGWPRFLSKDNISFIENLIQHNGAKNPVVIRFDQHQYHDIGYEKFRDMMCPAFSNPSSWVSLNFGASYKGGFLRLHIEKDTIKTELIRF